MPVTTPPKLPARSPVHHPDAERLVNEVHLMLRERYAGCTPPLSPLTFQCLLATELASYAMCLRDRLAFHEPNGVRLIEVRLGLPNLPRV